MRARINASTHTNTVKWDGRSSDANISGETCQDRGWQTVERRLKKGMENGQMRLAIRGKPRWFLPKEGFRVFFCVALVYRHTTLETRAGHLPESLTIPGPAADIFCLVWTSHTHPHESRWLHLYVHIFLCICESHLYLGSDILHTYWLW